MLSKTVLLAVAACALLAFPAVASAADQWTANGQTIAQGAEVSETYEGKLKVETDPPALAGSYTCEVTIKITVIGTANGTGDGKITEFNPTTTSCSGTGLFAKCELIGHSNNSAWSITLGATPLTVKGPIVVENQYANCTSGVKGTALTFNSISATPTYGASGIHSFSVAGTATIGTTLSGSVTAENAGILEVDH